jgi:hypothetical protein
VVDRERLAKLAGFDGNYLNMPQLLSHWQVKIERTSTPVLPMIRSTLALLWADDTWQAIVRISSG